MSTEKVQDSSSPMLQKLSGNVHCPLQRQKWCMQVPVLVRVFLEGWYKLEEENRWQDMDTILLSCSEMSPEKEGRFGTHFSQSQVSFVLSLTPHHSQFLSRLKSDSFPASLERVTYPCFQNKCLFCLFVFLQNNFSNLSH
jgi:hypothetical protein